MDQEQNKNNQQEQFRCTGDCLTCRRLPNEKREQWQYCAAQRTYDSMKMIEAMQTSLNLMLGTVAELKAKIEAIQNSETDVYNTKSSNESNELDENRPTSPISNPISPIGNPISNPKDTTQ